jgi:hypothetical protein
VKSVYVVLGALLLSGSVFAQSANDAGILTQSRGPNLFNGVPVVNGGPPSCPVGVITGAFTGTNTQDGRIFRDAIPSTCPNKVYPGQFGVGTTFNYETHIYPNTSAAAACVTVNFDPDTAAPTPCSTNAHASAYIGSYNPANQAANFVGDVGSSLAQPFSFEVPANSDMVLVVTNTSAAAVCNYNFEVVALPCTAIVTGPARPVPANDRTGMFLLAGLALLIGGLFFVRSRS